MTITIALSPLEVDVLEDARKLGGFATLDDLLRVSLWMEAFHMGIDVPVEAFALQFSPDLQRLFAQERARREAAIAATSDDVQGDLFATQDNA